MLTAEQLRAVIQQTAPFKRAQNLLHNDWQNVNQANPLMREMITVADLQFMMALQETQTDRNLPRVFDPKDYKSVMTFLRRHQGELAAGSQEWLLRDFE
ncbi:hypothetical protein [Secundilactobacillus folii]|uniref:Uncharacterized protein n=1 Tax=Secundilactobacillus folii TaxID=2678357 RepID=A0A7X3C1T2_9LACO|nr:hypothetical protein [Secundilactobacillus folii]MTV81117.1 hypothetical protein [Secundilactobacillus folii]